MSKANLDAKAAKAAKAKATTAYLTRVNQYIDTYQDRMIADLAEIVAIKSVSGSYAHHGDIQKMIKWIEARIKRLKCSMCERFDIGSYVVDGKSIKLPTVILAQFGKDIKKKTILVYCRYDVKNADPKHWQSDPWTIVQKGRDIFGRGTCKGKAIMLSWFHTIEAFLEQKIPLPVNLKFIIEGMSEMNCFGLEDFLYTQRITFLRHIDFICINESEWLNTTIPCISYGTCGICQYDLICTGDGSPGFDPNQIIEYIMTNFVDRYGNILIPKINDDVVQINPEIEQSLDKVQCDLSLIKKNLPDYMQSWSKQKILIRMWQMPQLISGSAKNVKCICSNESGGGDSTDTGGEGVSRKFVLKIVPVQTPDRCATYIMEHIFNLMKKKYENGRNNVSRKLTQHGRKLECFVKDGESTKVKLICSTISETRAWQENSVSPHYEAMKRATGRVFKDPPSIIKESIDSPVILILDKLVHKNTIIMPLTNNKMDDNFANECITKLTYFEGKKWLAAYLAEVAAI